MAGSRLLQICLQEIDLKCEEQSDSQMDLDTQIAIKTEDSCGQIKETILMQLKCEAGRGSDGNNELSKVVISNFW